MSKLKYNPIGSVFQEGDVRLTPREIEKGCACNGCWYNASKRIDGKDKYNYTKSCFVHGHACTPINRKDKKQVIFVEYKDELP